MAEGLRNNAEKHESKESLDPNQPENSIHDGNGISLDRWSRDLNDKRPALPFVEKDGVIVFDNLFEKPRSDKKSESRAEKMSEHELQSAAAGIVHFISKGNNFGTEFQRAEIGKFVNRAMRSDDLPGLCEQINAELEKLGSNYRVDFSKNEKSEAFGHWGISGDNPYTAEVKHRVWIKDYDKLTPTANLSLKEVKTGRVEDLITCSAESRRLAYPAPKGVSSFPGYISVPESEPVLGRKIGR